MRKLKNRKRGNQKGVTLFEVMIALALFAIIIVPVMKSFLTAVSVNKRSREVMIATDVAQEIMEGISGKTYQDVVHALGIANSGGFSFAEGDRKTSGKYALSSINDGFYNSGLRTMKIDIPTTCDKDENNGWQGALSDIDFCRAMAQDAVVDLQTVRFTAETPKAPFADLWDGDKTNAANIISSDKVLYYGVSQNKYPPEAGGEEYPKACYMLYTRIQKDSHFYDAVVTLTPTAQNLIRKTTDDPHTTKDDYKVIVCVFEYDYEDFDEATKTWPSRYDDTGLLSGSPVAVITSGIQYK